MTKKRGGGQRTQKQIKEFRSTIDVCSSKDLGYTSSDFTWCNMQEGEDRIYVRLDRALATHSWIDKYKEV